MMRSTLPWRSCCALTVWIHLAVACKANPPKPEPKSELVAAPLQAPVPPVLNPERPAMKSTPAVEPRRKREVLVGGCLATCETPKSAVAHFLQATMKRDIDTVRSHINTARFIHNGNRLGEGWAAQFLNGELGKRRTSIDTWLKSWLSWVDHIIDPADARVIDSAIEIVEQNQRRLLVVYRPPDRHMTNAQSPSATWRLTFEPRGLEWLVTKLQEHPQ